MSVAVNQRPSVTVVVLCICGAERLERCLNALSRQEGAPPFDVLVAYGPQLRDVSRLQSRFPAVGFLCNENQQTPLELASRALREARGEFVLVTKDHCAPRPDWVRLLLEAQRPDRAAVGGVLETEADARGADWAIYFVDFYRYGSTRLAGPADTLTVCNICYRRLHLEAVRPVWESFYHETAVHAALTQRFGPLWIEPRARVCMRRHVRLGDALAERYAFGRSFGRTRAALHPAKRWLYVLAGPAVPFMVLLRIVRTVLREREFFAPLVRSLAALLALVLAWSWGEWLGSLTGRMPRSFSIAPQRCDR